MTPSIPSAQAPVPSLLSGEASSTGTAPDSTPPWVSVKDRWPADLEQVLCLENYSRVGHSYQGVDVYYFRAGIGFVADVTDDDAYGCITHWMSLDVQPESLPGSSWHQLLTAHILQEDARRRTPRPLRPARRTST